MENFYSCPFCGENVKCHNSHHLKKCESFKKFIETNKEEACKLYYEQEMSMVDISEHFNIEYHHAQKMFKYLNLPIRGVKESTNTKRMKDKQAKTNLEKYGVENVFQRESIIRQNFEKRLLEEEGITNVFQRESVKQKIKETFKEKYTDDEIYYNYIKGSTLEYWIDKLGETDGKKEYERICYEKGKSSRLNYYQQLYGNEEGEKIYAEKLRKRASKSKTFYSILNDKMATLLKKHNITFKQELSLKRDDDTNKRYSYDFIIEDVLLLEMNGDFWHANPNKYKKHDILHFPGRYVVAEDLWKKDEHKKQLAINKGYKFLTIWESDFHNMSEETILNLIKNEISKDKNN